MWLVHSGRTEKRAYGKVRCQVSDLQVFFKLVLSILAESNKDHKHQNIMENWLQPKGMEKLVTKNRSVVTLLNWQGEKKWIKSPCSTP